MSTRHTINWLLALLIAMGLSTSYLLDGPDDITTAQAVADDLKAAQSGTEHATKIVAAYAKPTGARP
jgi:hypothetical protein